MRSIVPLPEPGGLDPEVRPSKSAPDEEAVPAASPVEPGGPVRSEPLDPSRLEDLSG